MAGNFDQKTNIRKYGIYFPQVKFWICRMCIGHGGSKEFSEIGLEEHVKMIHSKNLKPPKDNAKLDKHLNVSENVYNCSTTDKENLNLKNENKFCDVTLACDDNQIQAHMGHNLPVKITFDDKINNIIDIIQDYDKEFKYLIKSDIDECVERVKFLIGSENNLDSLDNICFESLVKQISNFYIEKDGLESLVDFNYTIKIYFDYITKNKAVIIIEAGENDTESIESITNLSEDEQLELESEKNYKYQHIECTTIIENDGYCKTEEYDMNSINAEMIENITMDKNIDFNEGALNFDRVYQDKNEKEIVKVSPFINNEDSRNVKELVKLSENDNNEQQIEEKRSECVIFYVMEDEHSKCLENVENADNNLKVDQTMNIFNNQDYSVKYEVYEDDYSKDTLELNIKEESYDKNQEVFQYSYQESIQNELLSMEKTSKNVNIFREDFSKKSIVSEMIEDHKNNVDLPNLMDDSNFKIIKENNCEPNNECLKCDFKSRYVKNMTTHIISVHNHKEQIYSCTLCNFISFESHGIIEHMRKDHEKTFSCEKCLQLFPSKLGLKMHEETVHEDSLHACKQCEYNTTNKNSLKRHSKILHNSKKMQSYLGFNKNWVQIEPRKRQNKEKKEIMRKKIKKKRWKHNTKD